MKTIGTVINTVIVVFGMLCSLIAGAFVGYSMAKDANRRPYTTYANTYKYSEGWNACKRAYGLNEKEETEDNEDN